VWYHDQASRGKTCLLSQGSVFACMWRLTNLMGIAEAAVCVASASRAVDVVLVSFPPWVCFFFQAEAGIRYWSVTEVQTCALPIYSRNGMPLEKPCSRITSCLRSR